MKKHLYTPQELKIYKNGNAIFNDEQMRLINKPTPEEYTEIKTDREGFTYKSVKVAYVKTLVNLVTGGNYSFIIKSKEFIANSHEVVVEARLQIGDAIREQIGQNYLNIVTDVTEGVKRSYAQNIGNAYKAATSDAFKKCASEFGFCWDIYGEQEFTEEQKKNIEVNYQELKKYERLDNFLKQCTNIDQLENTYERYLLTAKETAESKEIYVKYKKLLENE